MNKEVLLDVTYTRKDGKLVTVEIWKKEKEIKKFSEYLLSLGEFKEVKFDLQEEANKHFSGQIKYL